jgi:FkbM family methyltransferase
MTMQGILLKLFAAGLLRGPARRLLEHRTWIVESGEAAGLKLSFPQNLDFITGSTEPPVQRSLARYLKPGDVFYDIGANVGFFSLLAARCVGPQGMVYSFEPVNENTAAIRRNAKLNGLENLSVFEVALAEKSGSGELFLTKWDGGSSLSAATIPAAEPIEQRTVRVAALDDLIATEGLRPPTLVKIDVEGAEQGVIRGMLKTVARFKPVVLYEVDDGDKTSLERRWADLDHFVAGLGYSVTHLENSYPNVHWHVGHSLAVPLS